MDVVDPAARVEARDVRGSLGALGTVALHEEVHHHLEHLSAGFRRSIGPYNAPHTNAMCFFFLFPFLFSPCRGITRALYGSDVGGARD